MTSTPKNPTAERGLGWRNLHPWLLPLVLAGCTAAAFWPTIHNGFTDWDDPRNFVKNQDFRGLDAENLRWMATTYHLGVWQPVSWALLGFEYLLGGEAGRAPGHADELDDDALDPAVFHVTSLLLHVVNVVVLYLVTLQLLHRVRGGLSRDARVAAALATLLFALHPLRVEAVSWMSCQPYLPAALFYLLTVAAYVHGQSDRPSPRMRRIWFGVTLVCCALAMMSKAVAVSLPVVLILLDYYPLRRSLRNFRLWIEKIPFLAMATVTAVIAAKAKLAAESLAPLAADGIAARIALPFRSVGLYLHKTLLPVDICAYYTLPANLSLTESTCLVSAIIVVGITVIVVAAGRYGRRAPLTVWLAFLCTLAPNLGIVRIGHQLAADRYSYVASFGLVALLAGALMGVRRRSLMLFSAATVCVLLAVLTRSQVRVWRDARSLWEHTLSISPDCVIGHNNLGILRTAAGEIEEGMQHYQRAVTLAPAYPIAHYNMGRALRDEFQRYSAAAAALTRAVKLKPEFPQAHYELANTLAMHLDRSVEAVGHFETAIRQRPDYAEAYVNLGNTLAGLNRPQDAVRAFGKAVALGAEDSLVYNNIANAWFAMGDYVAALANYRKAIDLDPGNVVARRNFQSVLSRNGRVVELIDALTEALRHFPDDQDMINDLAFHLAMTGDSVRHNPSEALRLALTLRPEGPKKAVYLNTLAAAYAASRRFDEAISTAKKAEEEAITAGNTALAEAIANLAAGYARSRGDAIPSKTGSNPKNGDSSQE